MLNTSRCVYWDFNLRDGIGDWAEDGCVLVSADSEGITCHCNHLTNFAVLVVSVRSMNIQQESIIYTTIKQWLILSVYMYVKQSCSV